MAGATGLKALPSLSMTDRVQGPRAFPHTRPSLEKSDLIIACRRLKPHEITTALRHRYLPIHGFSPEPFIVAADERAEEEARKAGLHVEEFVDPDRLLSALQSAFGQDLVQRASLLLATRHPDYSAFTATPKGVKVLALLVLAAFAGMAFLPRGFLFMSLSVLFALIFLSVAALKFLSLLPGPSPFHRPRRDLPKRELPFYSVLVPLYRESKSVDQLMSSLTRLAYPRSRLDIKLILEEDDEPMVRHIRSLWLPRNFEIIVVPRGKPQTKPRALNYALYFARGELVTIYDAEDIPDPQQLRIAAETFAAAPARLACLQARLTYYNAGHNWLTRQFTIEYAALFDALLPVLGSSGLPMMLGGTSNHFRTAILRDVGGWDAFNVTEDADLGLRLARCGYAVDVLASSTKEESTRSLGSWLRQRARWIKGWMQTAIVHMRSPRTVYRELGPRRFFAVLLLFITMVGSSLAHPFFVALMAWTAFSQHLLPGLDLVSCLLFGLNAVVFVTGYGATMLGGLKGIRLRRLHGFSSSIFSMPAYWFIISAGAALALWQFFSNRFHWNKTEHGLMSYQPRNDLSVS